MRYEEDNTQISIANYLRMRGFLFTSTGGGIYIGNIATKTKIKRMGYQKGVSDLIVFINGGTLCIEVKKPKIMRYSAIKKKMVALDPGGKQSDSQKKFEADIKNIPGHYYLLATSYTEVAEFIENNNIKPK